jgi:CubicO group peptidase (beta-lactamase class C family)
MIEKLNKSETSHVASDDSVFFDTTDMSSSPLPPRRKGVMWSTSDVRRFHLKDYIGYGTDGADRMNYVARNPTKFQRHGIVRRGDKPIFPLRNSKKSELVEQVRRSKLDTRIGNLDLISYVNSPDSLVDAIIMLQGNEILLEEYPRMDPMESHGTWSVTKLFTGQLVAILQERGLIDSNDPIEKYIPVLGTSGWAGVSIRNLLDHASGIGAREVEEEAHLNPAHPFYAYEASFNNVPDRGSLKGRTVYEVVASFKNAVKPGTVFDYNSANSFVLGWLCEEILGLPFHELVSDEIWKHIGAENDAAIYGSTSGGSSPDGGMSCTLRDLARYGLIYTNKYREGITPILISDDHLRDIYTGDHERYDRSLAADGVIRNSETPDYASWHVQRVWKNGDIAHTGWGGQGLFVSPSRNIVIACFGSTDLNDTKNEIDANFRKIADAVRSNRQS